MIISQNLLLKNELFHGKNIVVSIKNPTTYLQMVEKYAKLYISFYSLGKRKTTFKIQDQFYSKPKLNQNVFFCTTHNPVKRL